jgi:hypothetical protein
VETAALKLEDAPEKAFCFDVVARAAFCADEADRLIAKALGLDGVDS